MWKELTGREEGRLRASSSFASRVRHRRTNSLALSNRKELVSPHQAAVNSLQVDLTEGRYLLSAASDASAAITDIQQPTNFEAGGCIAKHRSVLHIDKHHGNAHKFAISAAIWYPVDTGLFITASLDQLVKVWDTNTAQVVMDFKMPGKVYSVAMSSAAATHTLIAAGSADVQVRLCDISSGAFTHTLSGHRDGIMTLEWSNSSEWILISGGCDGAIRFWDIRRAGCFLVLDQSKAQLGMRPALSESTSNIVYTGQTTFAGQSSITKHQNAQKKTSLGNGKKQHLSARKSQTHARANALQRLHPGLSSTQNCATAHYGVVTGLKATGDGMYLLSSGSDSRLRLWDIESGCNTLVNFEVTKLQTSKQLQLAVSPDSSTVFVPCTNSVKVCDIWSGREVQTLRGHYDLVNCCNFHTQDQELYTGSNDRQILVWSPTTPVDIELGEEDEQKQIVDQDNWSE